MQEFIKNQHLLLWAKLLKLKLAVILSNKKLFWKNLVLDFLLLKSNIKNKQ
jgi:hypothetical protein